MSVESQQAVDSIQTKINELKNVTRLVTNASNLISDMEIKGAYAEPVAEVLKWLKGFGDTVKNQTEALEATLPKKEIEVVVPEIVEARS